MKKEFVPGDELAVEVNNYLMPIDHSTYDPLNLKKESIYVPYYRFDWCDAPNADGESKSRIQYRFELPEFGAF